MTNAVVDLASFRLIYFTSIEKQAFKLILIIKADSSHHSSDYPVALFTEGIISTQPLSEASPVEVSTAFS